MIIIIIIHFQISIINTTDTVFICKLPALYFMCTAFFQPQFQYLHETLIQLIIQVRYSHLLVKQNFTEIYLFLSVEDENFSNLNGEFPFVYHNKNNFEVVLISSVNHIGTFDIKYFF